MDGKCHFNIHNHCILKYQYISMASESTNLRRRKYTNLDLVSRTFTLRENFDLQILQNFKKI